MVLRNIFEDSKYKYYENSKKSRIYLITFQKEMMFDNKVIYFL